MTATLRTGALAGLLALALSTAACTVPEVSCEALLAQVVTCDVQPQAARCGASVSDLDRALLARALHDEGCGALREGDGRVKPSACAIFGWDCPDAIPHGFTVQAPRASLVFVSGIDGRPELDWSQDLRFEVEGRLGAPVHHVRLSPWAPVDVRARDLYDALSRIRAEGGGERFNLICYAVSGLDCRSMVSPGGIFAEDEERRRDAATLAWSITTVATPHRGTNVAHAALMANETVTERSLVSVLLGPRTSTPGLSRDDVLVATLEGLTNEASLAYNERVLDAPGVHYQSFAGLSYVAGASALPVDLLVERYCDDGASAPLVPRERGVRDAMSEPLVSTAPFATRTLSRAGVVVTSPTDGMISVDSAKWGRFRGCIPADHYDVIGQYDDGGPDPRTGFDAAAFYTAVASDLAAQGF